jgi:hypothetical protein
MFGLIVHGAGAILMLLFWTWAILDVIATDTLLPQHLPKGTWLFLVVFVPVVGAFAWLALGRPVGAGISLGGQKRLPYEYNPDRREYTQVRGLEDSAEWQSARSRSAPSATTEPDPLAIRERKLLEREAELARREAELAAPSETASDAPTEDVSREDASTEDASTEDAATEEDSHDDDGL